MTWFTYPHQMLKVRAFEEAMEEKYPGFKARCEKIRKELAENEEKEGS